LRLFEAAKVLLSDANWRLKNEPSQAKKQIAVIMTSDKMMGPWKSSSNIVAAA
jgi:hypothetical protein